MKRLLILFVLLATLVSVPVALAGPAMAVRSGGQWYWSPDLAEGLYPLRPSGEMTPYRHISGSAVWNGLTNLTRDQKNWLSMAVLQSGAMTGSWRPDFKDGTVVNTWHCRGIGKSIASVRIDVDLFHRFACAMRGAKYNRVGQFTAAIKNLRAQIKATPAPVPQTMLDGLVRAYYALGSYQAHGDAVTRTIPAIVTGRRDVTLIGVVPV